MVRKLLMVLGAAALSLAGPAARAADHLDGAQVKTDSTADLTDVYAWMSADKAKTYLIMNVAPQATTSTKFSNAVKYAFHVSSTTAFGMAPGGQTTIICTFDTAQKISCWVQEGTATVDYVTGDASNTAGIESASKKIKVFAGLRNDPFFFNLDGFKHAAATVHTAAGTLQPADFDNAGCVAKAGTLGLVNQLKQNATGGAPADFFKGLNVLSIVVAIDTTVVTGNGARPILGVWASTNK